MAKNREVFSVLSSEARGVVLCGVHLVLTITLILILVPHPTLFFFFFFFFLPLCDFSTERDKIKSEKGTGCWQF